jgi:hypothetical protein
VICVAAREEDAMALLACASAEPAIKQIRFNDYHRNCELVTDDLGLVLRTVYTAWNISPERKVRCSITSTTC